MKCRMNITGCKIWKDNNNADGTRPDEPLIITLLRDGKAYRTATVDPAGDGKYRFLCLPISDGEKKFVYTVDEPEVPDGYIKTIQGCNIINTLDIIPVNVK